MYKKLSWILIYGIIFILWTLYRFIFFTPEWVDEFIAKPLLQILPVLLVVRFFEKKSLSSLSIGSKRLLLHIGIGLGIGLLLVTESLIIQKMKGTVLTIQLNNLLVPFLVSLATGFTEELVYRGYFARRIADGIENAYIANTIQSLLFVLIHVPIMIFVLHYSFADSLFYSLQLFVLGFVYGYIFLETESIVSTVIPHTLWNFANVIFR
jgi:membrane protease YdiL (CAAX protease family)